MDEYVEMMLERTRQIEIAERDAEYERWCEELWLATMLEEYEGYCATD